ncbi:MAG TPA: hypothetical protein VHR66_26870 [Gemmataceae bacterium]|jgi:hypothetical protein|nr:hypothetical protein [Gemmataceae bacterium]
MRRLFTLLQVTILGGLAAIVVMVPTTRAGDVGFIEDFALARDRSEALKQLIPGTEDYYYYQALHYLNTEQFDKAVALSGPWHERHGQTGRLTEIQTRHALLTFDKDPKKSLDYLKNRMGLYFDQQKETVGAPPNLPTTLDQKMIARATLKADAFARWPNLDNFEDAALDWLAADTLNWERRRNLLQRLQRPDIADLPKLIVEDLKAEHAPDYGAFPIHMQLTLAQLDELVKLRPELLNHQAYVRAYITKLQPGADVDWKRDRQATLAYLERLQTFVDRLAPVHNSLKAHIAYHRLAFDRARGIYDAQRFLEYIKLPRFQSYMAQAWNEREESKRHPADLNADYSPTTLMPPIATDEPLVRSYLKQFFVAAASTKEYEPYINDVYLSHLFAETKIENGLGDPETWASRLPPELFRQLKDRIDIDFAFTNKTDFAADEPVKLDLFIKNVPNLLVKVFEINTKTVYRTTLQEVDTDVNLDGLVANSEKTQPFNDPPLRRQARRFEFPEMTKPGVYVIDFIGGGKSSRALIRKGRLRPLVQTGTAGQDIRVIDDQNKPVLDATAWLGGVEYKADKEGTITVPFTAEPGRRPIVLSKGDLSSLDHLNHQPESYRLVAGIHVDRESLLTQNVASILVRPGLYLNNTPVSIKLLEEVKLRVTSVDLNGIPSSVEVPDFKLFEDRESIHEIRVPVRLQHLSVALIAKVKNLSAGKPVDLSASQDFSLNQIDKTDKIEDLHLARFGADYVIELLGRSGEPKMDRPVQLSFKHREFKEEVRAMLKSDAKGRVNLGPLADIVTVTATGPEGVAHKWTLSTDAHTYRVVIHAKVGDPIMVPYLGGETASRADVALFEMRGSDIRADKFDAVAVKDGRLVFNSLAAGDYDLWLKRTGERIRIRVVDGPIEDGYVLGQARHLELAGLKAVTVQSVVADADSLVIQLRDASKFARVHVFASRYQPAFSAYRDLAAVRDAELGGVIPGHAESIYLTGRNIGDEYRYVLDRRGQPKRPGNMLERPSLLLNPWAIRTTETGEQVAAGGDDFSRGGGVHDPVGLPDQPGLRAGGGNAASGTGDFSNLDFLADSSAVVVNLVPDKDGVVRVPRNKLGPHAMVHVVAVDPLGTTARSIALPEQPAKFNDLRLATGLDPQKHFTQQKQVTVVPAGEQFVIADLVSSRFQMYDSLPKVFAFYKTLTKDPNLNEFGFVMGWDKLKPEEKQTLYSKYACHELNYFLFRKDQPFFNAVIRLFLRNKKDKTFMDHWLIGDAVASYLDPWHYGRLNTVERVLLAQRIANEPEKTIRHLNDMVRLLPPLQDRDLYLFNVGVDSGGLETDEGVLGKVREERKKLEDKAKDGPKSDDRGEPKSEAPRPTDGLTPPPGVTIPAPGMPGGGAMPPAKKGGPGGGRRPGTPGEYADKESEQRNGQGDSKKGKESKSELYYRGDADKRSGTRQLFRKLDPTQEWAENNYYKRVIQTQIADLVPVGRFWADLAAHDGKSPFLSKHLADASRNFTEMMFALSVLDLPFEAPKHEVKFENGRMSLTPGGRMIAFHEEVRPAAGQGGQVPILVSENFYRNGDRFRDENGERLDKFVTAEFVVHTVYGCQIVVTNPTSSKQKLTVLLQLPVGAIPVANGQFTRSLPVDLEPYHTQTIDYFFYFPKPGRFTHFPVHVAKNEQYIASGGPFTFDVVAKPTKLDTQSWEYISQNGTSDEVLAFLNRENVRALNLDKIAFRMRDRAFFESVTTLLNDRHLYHPTLWSFGLYHGDVAIARQFLLNADNIVNESGGPIDSTLLTINPVDRHQYEHLEYKPLVNARAHALGHRRQIVNDAFLGQYHKFLKTLSYHKQLDDTDLLATTYFLLLQDRVDEAAATFARVNPDRVATNIQYDYCQAYLDMFNDEPKKARSIAMKYVKHPVDRWRNTFTAIISQLDEIEGKGPRVVDANDRDQQQGVLAATEPNFEFTLDNKAIQLSWQNVETITINYYLMDVELLFSRNPFVQRSGGQFASIRPNLTREMKLPAGKSALAIPLPDELVRRNVLVEVTGAGKTRTGAYYANAMDVKFTENYGQVRVLEGAEGKPLSKVYVKVYAKLGDGSVKFHKDGYTDLRGRFDYVSVNTPERQPIERFAVLVLSEERGALIRDVNPPQR